MKRVAKTLGFLALLAAPAYADDDKPAEPTPDKPADKPDEADAKPAEQPVAPTVDVPKAEPPPQQVRVAIANGLLQRHGLSPDITVNTGIRLYNGDGDDSRWWFARARAGIVLYQEPTFLSVGVAAQAGPLNSGSIGIEATYINLWSGVWVDGGIYPLDRIGGVIGQAGLGYTLFGIEYQRRLSGPRHTDSTLCIVLNIPLGTVRVEFQEPEGVIHLPKVSPTAVH